MKRTIFLLSVLIILVVGWSAAWHFIEAKVVEVAETAKTRLAERGQQIDCSDQVTGGYPFRITFNCSSVSYENQRSGLVFEAGELRSAAQAYQPGKVVMEIDSPASFETVAGGRFKVDWESLRGSMKVGLSGRERTSLVGKDFDVTPLQDPSRITVSEFEYHDRLVGENDVDVALSMVDLKEVSSSTLELVDFDLRSEATFKDIHDRFSRGRNLMSIIRESGVKGELHRLQVAAANGAEVKLSGPFDAGNDGLLNGKMKVEIKDLDALLRLIIFFNPQHEQNILRAGEAIKLVRPADENNTRSITLTIQDNVIKLGFVPLGRIPFWL
ncbi:MAG: DUF2125 domain-containing protein [Rhizobiaceae bacterium]|nr:DUF2125 domain-containing protein [Rhizobiaceae bacterium]